MKRKLTILIILLMLIVIFGQSGDAAEATVLDILKHADRARGNVGGIIWDITIATNDQGGEVRGLRVTVKGNDTLAKYTRPAIMSDRMVLMQDRNMWFIRSGLKKPVSISPRQKLMGDAANGDIASTNYAGDYEAVLTGEDAVGTEACYVLDLKATSKNVTYDRIKYWVSKDRLVGVKAEFYTLSGKLFKTADFKYHNRITLQDGTEIPFVSELVIRDAIQQDKMTTMTYSNIKIETIPDSTFNLNALVR